MTTFIAFLYLALCAAGLMWSFDQGAYGPLYAIICSLMLVGFALREMFQHHHIKISHGHHH